MKNFIAVWLVIWAALFFCLVGVHVIFNGPPTAWRSCK